jgi:hypothetical protein
MMIHFWCYTLHEMIDFGLFFEQKDIVGLWYTTG